MAAIGRESINCEPQKLLRDCRNSLLDTISNLLHDNSLRDWKILADELNYTHMETTTFGNHANKNRTFACYEMLQDWMKKDGSTVLALIAALRNMERQDVVRKMQEQLREKYTITGLLILTIGKKLPLTSIECDAKNTLREAFEQAIRSANSSFKNLQLIAPTDVHPLDLDTKVGVVKGRTVTFKEIPKTRSTSTITGSSLKETIQKSNKPSAIVPPLVHSGTATFTGSTELNLREDDIDSRNTTLHKTIRDPQSAREDDVDGAHPPLSRRNPDDPLPPLPMRGGPVEHSTLVVAATRQGAQSRTVYPAVTEAENRKIPVVSSDIDESEQSPAVNGYLKKVSKQQPQNQNVAPKKFLNDIPHTQQTSHSRNSQHRASAGTQQQSSPAAHEAATPKLAATSQSSSGTTTTGTPNGAVRSGRANAGTETSDSANQSAQRQAQNDSRSQRGRPFVPRATIGIQVTPQSAALAPAINPLYRNLPDGHLQGPNTQELYERLRPSRPGFISSIPENTPGWYPSFPQNKSKVKEFLSDYLMTNGAYIFRPHEERIPDSEEKKTTIMLSVTHNRQYKHFLVHKRLNEHGQTVFYFYRTPGTPIFSKVLDLINYYRDHDLYNPDRQPNPAPATHVRLALPLTKECPSKCTHL